MITLFSNLAEKLYPRRWHFASITGATFVVLLILIFVAKDMAPILSIAFVLAGPIVAISWGLLCLAIWFHPEHGKLMWKPSGNAVLRALQIAARGYGAIFLGMWFAFGVLVWPILFFYRLQV
jgi:hypothetical protein